MPLISIIPRSCRAYLCIFTAQTVKTERPVPQQFLKKTSATVWYWVAFTITGLFLLMTFPTLLLAKMQLPANLSVDVVASNGSDAPVTLSITAVSRLSSDNTKIWVVLTDDGNILKTEQVLWQGEAARNEKIELTYRTPVLAEGKYQINIFYRFQVESSLNKTATIRRVIYLDMQTQQVSFSKRSFRDIQRQKLKKEIDAQGAQLYKKEAITRDPTIQKRIKELNRLNRIDNHSLKRKTVNQSDNFSGESDLTDNNKEVQRKSNAPQDAKKMLINSITAPRNGVKRRLPDNNEKQGLESVLRKPSQSEKVPVTEKEEPSSIKKSVPEDR